MLVVAAGAGEQSDDLGAIATENEDKSAALDGNFGVEFQVVEAGNDCRKVASAAMLFVVGKQAGRAIAIVRNFESGVLEFFDQTRGAQSGRSLFSTSQECRSAGTRANQGNLLRLTDDFDRQSHLLKFLKIRPA